MKKEVGIVNSNGLLKINLKNLEYNYNSLKKIVRPTTLTNTITKTKLNGAIPDQTRLIIQAHAHNYVEEATFYQDVKQLLLQLSNIPLNVGRSSHNMMNSRGRR